MTPGVGSSPFKPTDDNNTTFHPYTSADWLGVGTGTATPTTTHYIGAMFEEPDFKLCSEAVHGSIQRMNRDPTTRVRLRNVSLASFSDVGKDLIYLCDAIQHHNITSMIVIGGQNMINTVSIATKYLGIPIIGYNTGRGAVSVKVSLLTFFD
jgi:hypothetical protein